MYIQIQKLFPLIQMTNNTLFYLLECSPVWIVKQLMVVRFFFVLRVSKGFSNNKLKANKISNSICFNIVYILWENRWIELKSFSDVCTFHILCVLCLWWWWWCSSNKYLNKKELILMKLFLFQSLLFRFVCIVIVQFGSIFIFN